MRRAAPWIALVFLLLLAAATASATVVLPRTLTRDADPVVVQGSALEPLLGLPIGALRVYAWRDGAFVPVPYQFDQRGKKGDYVFPFGPKADPGADDDLLDGNDELVFMAADAGGLAPDATWVPGWDKAASVEITDPVDGGRAWVFVLHFAKAPARSPVDYVRYDGATATVHAKSYRMAFHPKAPIGIGDLAILPAAGGDGVDRVDRLKIRFQAVGPLGIHIDKNEEEFTAKTVAWIDGPVRVIRRTANRMILFWNIPTPSAELDNVYYGNAFEFPTRVDLPFDSDTFISQPVFRVSTDLTCGLAKGWVFHNEHNPAGVTVDGFMSDAEKKLDRRPYKWSAMRAGTPGASAGWLNRLLYPTINTPVHPTLYYRDDASRGDGPEDDPGECGDLGYFLEGIDKVKKGRFELVSVMYAYREYSPATVTRLMNILDHPLKTSVSPVRRSAPPAAILP